MSRLPFREQVLRAREEAIVASVNRLLAEKGYDLMTVDEVASDVGIGKASLYKHFASKEALAAAAMVKTLERALAYVESIDPTTEPLTALRAVARWAMQRQLDGEMPSLPSQNSALRATLGADKVYMTLLMRVSDRLEAWITAAQASGQLDPTLPPEVILYTLFARACDPVLGVLRAGGQYEDEQILGWLLSTCFDGLAGRRG